MSVRVSTEYFTVRRKRQYGSLCTVCTDGPNVVIGTCLNNVKVMLKVSEVLVCAGSILFYDGYRYIIRACP